MALSPASRKAVDAKEPARARIAFVLPRTDWVECNASLMASLAQDQDVSVALVCAENGPVPPGLSPEQVSVYPFFTRDSGIGVTRLTGLYGDARRKRRIIDQFFLAFKPDCLVVISTASREMLPWVRLARRRGIRILQLQSVFLAPNLRAHVTGENARLMRSRGISGLARLAFRRVVQELAGLPGAILKSPEQAAGADRVFAINAAQAAIYAEHLPPDRIEATGAPLLDYLHDRVVKASNGTSEAAVRAQWNIAADAPLGVYVSKSLEKFCQDDPRHEREFQAFAVNAFLNRFPQAVLIVKLHPIEDARAFQDVADHPRVRIVKEGDIHQIVHYADLVISLGTSTPAFYAVFHGRPRIIIREADGIPLDYQRQLIDVSVAVRTRAELESVLDDLRSSGWPASLPSQFSGCQDAARQFGADFDGACTPRVHARFRAFLGLSAS
jgi:hypothetical protein